MFGAPPEGYTPTEADEDRHARLTPSARQFAIAATMIRETVSDFRDTFDTCRVVVPIALPGKSHGIWQIGQAVEHPPGFWLDNDTADKVNESTSVRDLAERAADHHLGDRDGTPAYAYIWLQDGWAASSVFEGFREARRLTRPEWRGIAESAGIFVQDVRDGEGVHTGRGAWWEGYGQAVADLAAWIAGDQGRTADLAWAIDGPERPSPDLAEAERLGAEAAEIAVHIAKGGGR